MTGKEARCAILAIAVALLAPTAAGAARRGPDLRAAALSGAPATVRPGASLKLTVTIRNTDRAKAHPSTLRLLLRPTPRRTSTTRGWPRRRSRPSRPASA
jgi:hypothetical protein